MLGGGANLPPLPPQPPRREWDDGMPRVPIPPRNEATPLEKLMFSGTCLAGGVVVQMGTFDQPDMVHQLAYAGASMAVALGALTSFWHALEAMADQTVRRKWLEIEHAMKTMRGRNHEDRDRNR